MRTMAGLTVILTLFIFSGCGKKDKSAASVKSRDSVLNFPTKDLIVLPEAADPAPTGKAIEAAQSEYGEAQKTLQPMIAVAQASVDPQIQEVVPKLVQVDGRMTVGAKDLQDAKAFNITVAERILKTAEINAVNIKNILEDRDKIKAKALTNEDTCTTKIGDKQKEINALKDEEARQPAKILMWAGIVQCIIGTLSIASIFFYPALARLAAYIAPVGLSSGFLCIWLSLYIVKIMWTITCLAIAVIVVTVAIGAWHLLHTDAPPRKSGKPKGNADAQTV
mgnify:CR=1 FL=1